MRKRTQSPTVLIVDDDPSTLRSLKRLILTAGFKVKVFDRPSAPLADTIPTCDACLVVAINLLEMNGIEMSDALARSGCALPVILGGGGGSCWPLMFIVALGEPGRPLTCWARAGAAVRKKITTNVPIPASSDRSDTTGTPVPNGPLECKGIQRPPA